MGKFIGCSIWIFLVFGMLNADEPWVKTVSMVLGILIIIVGIFSGGGGNDREYGNEDQF